MTPRHPHGRLLIASLATAGLASCGVLEPPANSSHAPPAPLPALTADYAHAAPRVSGGIGATDTLPPPVSSTAAPVQLVPGARTQPAGRGTFQLDFADTDVREVVAQILGTMLGANYTIDPGVHGTVTLRTAQPLTRAELIPALETVLAQNGDALIKAGSLYRVTTGSNAGAVVLTTIVLLHYASAEDLAKLLQPYAQNGAKIVANGGSNAVIISGDPMQREALAQLVQAFDVDALAGQSYALLPVDNGAASDFATALQGALKSKENAALAGVVKVIAMSRIGAVLVVASNPRYVQDAERIYSLVVHNRNATMRSWHVHYLENGRANDVAFVLQEAFTPDNVTATPSSNALGGGAAAGGGVYGVAGLGGNTGAPGGGAMGGGGLGGAGGLGGGTSGLGGGGGASGIGGGGGFGGAQGGAQGGLGAGLGGGLGGRPGGAAGGPGGNPLLGGLGGGGAGGGGDNQNDTMRIIPDPQNNSILLYGTAQEVATMEAMLNKVDILPLQVRIDAVIAEVDLNDALKFGTQFFFNQGINAALSYGTAFNTFSQLVPGFNIGGRSGKGFTLQALQDVTKVNVLSSPQLMVLDDQPARLQVGNLVPYQTGSAQSTLTTGAPLVSTIDYRETGVIMQVTPRVNSNGLVTLDIAQEVSGVSSQTSGGLNSPTFSERAVQSRVVVQDGQTIGLAGLISDSDSHENQGIPWLKDIPLIGFLAGNQINTRTRTELLVLLTPHVIHDARDARALTEDLREGLPNAARVPTDLQFLPASGSADPTARLRHRYIGP